MAHFNSIAVIFFFSMNIANVFCLNAESVAEGPCNIPSPASNIDFDWVRFDKNNSNNFWYFNAGSKYILYRVAAGGPDFPNMRDFEFYYDFCPTVFLNYSISTGFGSGFGGSIGSYKFSSPQPGVMNWIPQPSIPGAGQTLQGVITLTDNRSFIFLYKCFLEENQRGWDIFSLTPTLSPYVQREIEAHAVSLGLDRSQFQFLRYNSCHQFPGYLGFSYPGSKDSTPGLFPVFPYVASASYGII